MKVQIASDLHLEHWYNKRMVIPEQRFKIVKDRDLLVLAGDIHTYKWAVPFIYEQMRYSPVIYVLGNHEYYTDIPRKDVLGFWIEFEYQCNGEFYLLNNDYVEIQGKSFYGTPFLSSISEEEEEDISDMITDFRIGGGYWTPRDHTKEHLMNVDKMKDRCKHNGRFDMVITHFPPSLEALSEKYKDSLVNSYYINNRRDLVELINPKYWIYGHTHYQHSYDIGGVTCIGNPSGYPFEIPNKNFRPDYVVEV